VNGELLTLASIGIVLAGAVIPRLSLDVAAVLALALLVVGGVLDPSRALSGFGTPTLVVVGGMFILADALQRTGAAQGVGTLVENAAARGPRWLLFALLPLVMVLSGIMNNTGVVVLLLPLLIAAGQEVKISPSRLLLPLSYASITGGTLTLVGTTTTLLVDGIVRQYPVSESAAARAPEVVSRAGTYEGFAFLEILPMGAVFCITALLYLVFVGPKLLPNRTGLVTPMGSDTTRQYMTEIFLSDTSRLIGRTLADFPRLTKKIRFLQLIRGEETHWPPFTDVPLEADDLFLVKGSPTEIVDLLQQPGLEGPPDPGGGGRVMSVDLALAEVMVGPQSRLDHQMVREARIRDRFGVVVLAVLRSGEHLRQNLGGLRLRVGDILLVQGEPTDIARLARNERDLVLLGGAPPVRKRRKKARLAIVTTAGALGLSAVGLIPLPVAVLLAAVLLTAGGCLTSTQAYRSIDLRILVILGCMLGVGMAAQQTGLAARVADGLTKFGGQWGPVGVLAMVYLTTALLTELVTNAGTAAIMVPIAIEAADKAGVSHRPFVFAVALAASCSFLTPIGYQTNLLVYGPGGYRLVDYLKLGTPLVLLLWMLATWLLPIVYPF
jgi:di/tricarboxylate transporter